ncbi:MAG: hypothetical protein M3R08_06180 [Bacteroidota bacterium]|nr:hypothetical protein [Bacteroidota bacterium]
MKEERDIVGIIGQAFIGYNMVDSDPGYHMGIKLIFSKGDYLLYYYDSPKDRYVVAVNSQIPSSLHVGTFNVSLYKAS